MSRKANEPHSLKIVKRRHCSTDQNAFTSKMNLMKELKDSKKINVAELLK